ncbi:MAG TPA: hypothetical protein VIU44_08125 [Gaiellaceae bacterium]
MTTFPDVPDVPGVPPLPRDPNAVAAAIVMLTGDIVSGYGAGLVPVWGIYRGGRPVITADTIVGFEFKREWAIADYPVEQGSFASYDKVATPYVSRVQFAAGGDAENRQLMLDSLDAIAGDLQLYDVVTPERVYRSANVQRYDYRRAAQKGVGLLVVDVYLQEVRTSAGQQGGASTQSPSGASPQQDGDVQPWGNVSPTSQSVQGIASGQSQFSTTGPTGFNPAPVSSSGFNLLPVM